MDYEHAPLLLKFLSMLLVILITTQCVAAPTVIETQPVSLPAISENTTLPQATLSGEEINLTATEESVPVDMNNIPYLGSSTFTVDSSTRAEGEYKADGSEFQL